MVCEGGVTAVPGWATRHMASDAVLRRPGMRLGQAHSMTSQTARTVVLRGIFRLLVRVVTGSAPHPAIALVRAGAAGELLDVTHYLESAAGADIGCPNAFQFLAGLKIGKLLGRIQDSSFAAKMTLFTNAVASPWSELGRIHDIGG